MMCTVCLTVFFFTALFHKRNYNNFIKEHKGRTRISKRGRRKLRKILYQVMVSLLARNKEFRGIYDYYVTRVKNPLKRRQAMVAVSCKLIWVFYAVLTKGVEYDRFKMMSDIHRKSDIIAAWAKSTVNRKASAINAAVKQECKIYKTK